MSRTTHRTTHAKPNTQNHTHRITSTEPHTAPLPKSGWCVLVCLQQSMAETFYLSNIVPQNYENNAGFWNRCVSCFKTLLRSGTGRYPTLEHCSIPLRTKHFCVVVVYVCRLEMYCRDLTKHFQDVWIVSGPLALPEEQDDGKRMVTYQVASAM